MTKAWPTLDSKFAIRILSSHGKQFVNADHGMPLWLDGPLSQRFRDKINKYINIANLAN